ncbi:hypothetical protein BsWGS_19156 [Bradybaena similaris]
MTLTLLFALLVVALGAADEKTNLQDQEIIDAIRRKSDPDVIPIDAKDPKPVQVRLENSLLYVVTADEESEVVEMIVRQRYTWRNQELAWITIRPGLVNVTVPQRAVWSPDVAPVNSVTIQETLSPELVVISSDGEITYSPQTRIGVHADLKGLESASGAKVSFTFESWTHDITKFRFEEPTSSSFSLEEFESSRFQVSNAKVERHTRWHPSRPKLHDAQEISFVLKKKN